MNRRALLSMVVSWLLIGSVMNIEGRRPSGLLEQASAHAAPCASPEYHQLDFWVGDWDVFDVAARLILLAQFVVERDGRVDALLVDGLSQNTGQLLSIRTGACEG